jgi:hypothetical protein
MHSMNGLDATEVTLSADDCLDLLRTKTIGRIAYTDRALPAIGLVSYRVDNGTVVLQSDASVSIALRDAVVAFQADDMDPVSGTGWSVTCVGRVVTVPGSSDTLLLEPTLVRGWRTRRPAPEIRPGAARAS